MMLSGENQSIGLRAGQSPARRLISTFLALGIAGWYAAVAAAQLTALRVEDYAIAPMTGATAFPSATANNAYLARINFMADDPSNGNQFFVNDLNGPFYIVDKTTKSFTEYLNFNGANGNPGLFENMTYTSGFANGFITFRFDPDYANNGKFYTVHMQNTSPDNLVPKTANYPNLNVTNYGPTASIDAPGSASRQTVLIQWTDTDITNSTFEGTARELFRMDMVGSIHPMGDLIFNPTAGPEDPDWRVMYISVGDGSAGEQGTTSTRRTPQRLDSLGGKILRIVPDSDGINVTTTTSANGKYLIPTDNPFTSIANSNVKDEVYALGLRNPHRMSWDVDPTNPENNHLFVSDIGLHTWEEVNIIHPGQNYGYSDREGNEVLIDNNTTGPIPENDTLPLRITNTVTSGTITPTYPVIQYGHGLSGQDQLLAGDSVSSGYVYRGSKIPQLYGKFIFGDITTGVIYYSDLEDMLAADDGDPSTLADFHAINLLWDNPNDGPDLGEQSYGTLTTSGAIRGPMHQIVEAGYEARGGQDPDLPGGASVTGSFGRADIRIQVDDQGELYIISKSDGMIRAITGPEPLPGDYNYDGVVDAEDYNTWKSSYGTAVPRLGLWADGNKDGFVDSADYTIWRDNFLEAAAGSISVPEPATWLLLATAAGLTLARRRWR